MRKQICLLLLSLIIATRSSAAQDSITIHASDRYKHPALIGRILAGANYRDIWAMPVRVKIFRINEAKGGLIAKEMGGGLQTTSLQLEDKSGKKWVLRSVDKNVERAMEVQGIKNKRIRKFSQQMISGAHPYGALTLSPMAKALGILSLEPELVYIPDDPALGAYRSELANTMATLELREPVFHEGDDVDDTEKMLKKLKEKKGYKLDQKMLLQARLLDMLVADWDRHEDQWKWTNHKQPDGTTMIYPIARDHDQAYFNSSGLVFGVLRTFNAKRFVGFRDKLKLKALNYKQWYFDKTFMKDLTEEDWRNGVQTFQAKLTDDVLGQSAKRLPREVYVAHGEDFLNTLRARRDRMPRDVMKYYHFLQNNPRKVEKQGEKQREKFEKANKLKKSLSNEGGKKQQP